ncbi:MAG: hypothetical protein Q8N43_00065, partial [Candidatus Azambacteria bacterium]|nr:hypothetical protein [Candidatus Azambacteria bacterium]
QLGSLSAAATNVSTLSASGLASLTNGADVTNANFTVGGNSFVVTTAGAASSTSLIVNGTVAFTTPTNSASAFLVKGATSTILTITTTPAASGNGPGYVGIASSTPGFPLSVLGNSYLGGTLTVSGNALFQNATTTGLTVQGGTSLGSLAFGNATGTALTVTGGTQLGALNINGQNFVVTNAGAASSTSLSTSGNVYVGGNLTVIGTTNLGNISFTNASTTYMTVSDTAWITKLYVSGNTSLANATTTGLTVQGGTLLGSLVFGAGTSTSLTVTGGTSLGSLGVSGLTNLANLMAGNATTTGLTVQGGIKGGSLDIASGGLFYSGGNVGIGTTTPSAKLSIQGDEYLYGNLTITGTGGVGSNLTVIGQTFLSDGTAAAPSLAFTNDINLGLFRAGTDILGFTTNGSERMRIDASGNIGLGTTTTNVAQVNIGNNLAVFGTASSSFNGIVQFNGIPSGTNIDQGSIYLNPATAGTNNVILGMAVSGTEKVRIDTEGDVQTIGLFNSTNTSGTNDLFGHLSVRGNTTLGDATSDTITFNGRISSDIVPSVDLNYSLGSASLRFNKIYAGELVATSTTAGGTASSTFVINNDNLSNDIEDSSLQFSRGSQSPSAIIKWDSSNKRFDFNAFPVNFQKNIIVGNTASSTFNGPVWFTGASQGIATSSAVVYINPSSGPTNYNLFDIAVAGTERFKVDAEGDTTIWGSLGVENTIYDLSQDTLTINDSLQINGNIIKDSASITRISIGASNEITGNLNIASGNLTVGGNNFTVTTAGAASSTSLTTSGNAYIGGNLTVIGTTNLGNISFTNASTTYLTVSDTAWINKLNVSGLSTLANVSAANATTTGLTVQGGTLLGSLVFGAGTSTSLTVTGGTSLGSLGVS